MPAILGARESFVKLFTQNKTKHLHKVYTQYNRREGVPAVGKVTRFFYSTNSSRLVVPILQGEGLFSGNLGRALGLRI